MRMLQLVTEHVEDTEPERVSNARGMVVSILLSLVMAVGGFAALSALHVAHNPAVCRE